MAPERNTFPEKKHDAVGIIEPKGFLCLRSALRFLMRVCRSKAYRSARKQEKVITSLETHMLQDNDAFEPTGPEFRRNEILSAGRAFFKRRKVPPIWPITV